MRTASLICIGLLACFVLLATADDHAHDADHPQQPASASASSTASANAAGGDASAKAKAEAIAKAQGGTAVKPADTTKTDTTKLATKPVATKPDATKTDTTKPDATKPDATKPGTGQPDFQSVSIWRDYSRECAGKNFDPKKTTPATCATLSGKLCSRKDVKCGAGKTDFLDPSGAVVRTGINENGLLCPKNGGPCSVA